MSNENRFNSLNSTLLLILIFAVAFGVRFIHLDADPPAAMDLHFISDEGWWVHNARNKALFGEWILDDFNQSLLVSPPFCLGTWLSYRFLGVSLASSRVAAAVSGFIATILLFFILKKKSPDASKMMGTLLLGAGFAFTCFNRMAFVESTAFMFVLLSWLFLEYVSDRVWGVFLAGLSAGVAIATKSYVLSLAPVLGVLWFMRIWVTKPEWRTVAQQAFLFSGGVAAVVIFWLKHLYIPFQDEYRIMYSLWQNVNLPGSAAQIIRNLPSFLIQVSPQGIAPAGFIRLNGVLILLAAWRLLQVMDPAAPSLKEVWKNMPQADKEALIWLGITILLVAPLSIKTFRRFIFMYPPLLTLAARTVSQVRTHPGLRRSRPFTITRMILMVGVPVMLIAPWVASWIHGVITSMTPPGPNALWTHPMLIAVGMMGLLFVIGIVVAGRLRLHTIVFPAIPLLMGVAVIAVGEGTQFIRAWSGISFTIRDTSRYLGETYFDPGMLVLGGVADTLCLENNARTVAIWGAQEARRVLNQNPIRRYQPSYILVLTELDGIPWVAEERYTKYLSKERLVEPIGLIPHSEHGYRIRIELYTAPREEPFQSSI